jgi:hypothetical protein
VLKDPNASANEKRAAQLELEKIDADQRRRLLVADQKTAVDAATAKLDAAKEVQSQAQDEFDARKAQIQLISDQNNLLKEQLQLLERLANAGGGGPKPPKAGGAGTPQPFGIKPFDISKLIPPDLKAKWDEFTAAIGNAWDKIAAKFQPTIDAINTKLIPAINNLWGAVRDKIPKVEDEFAKTFAFMINQSALAGPTIVTNVGTALDNLAAIIRSHGDTIISGVGFIFRAAFTAATLVITDISASFASFFIVLSAILDVGSLLIQGKFQDAWDRIKKGWSDFWGVQLSTADTDLGLVANLFGLKWDEIKASIQTAWNAILPTLTSLWSWLSVTISGAVTALTLLWTGTFQPALVTFETWYNEHLDPLFNALANLVNTVVYVAINDLSLLWSGTFLPALTDVWKFITDHILPSLQDVTDKVNVTLQPVLQTFHDFLNSTLIPLGLNVLKGAFDGITSAIDFVTTAINDLATAIKNLPAPPSWWKPGSPTPFETGMWGISSALQSVTSDMYQLRAATINLPGTVSPVASYSSYTHAPVFNYSPTYHSAPGPVSDNFATMSALWA